MSMLHTTSAIAKAISLKEEECVNNGSRRYQEKSLRYKGFGPGSPMKHLRIPRNQPIHFSSPDT